VPDEVNPQEPGPAGDENLLSLHRSSFSYLGAKPRERAS
jgi:hypothetical protein